MRKITIGSKYRLKKIGSLYRLWLRLINNKIGIGPKKTNPCRSIPKMDAAHVCEDVSRTPTSDEEEEEADDEEGRAADGHAVGEVD